MKMKIGDITEIIDGDRGKNYPKKSDFKDEGFCLFLNTGNVTSDGFVFKKNDFISEEKSNKLRKGKLERGDLVFTTRGTVGNVAYYSDNIPYDHVRINSGMVIFRVFEKKVFNKFLYQILKHKNSRIYIRQYCTGSAQPQLPIMNLRNIELNIPPLETQYKIARILLAYDDLIENNERQIKLLEEAAQRLYKEWFVDLHFPGNEDVEIVDGVPEGWTSGVLGDVAINSGKKEKKEKRNNYKYYLPIDCIPKKSLGYDQVKDVSLAKSSLIGFQKGDILFGAMRPYFHKVVVARDKGLTRTTCFVLNAKEPSYWSYIAMLLFTNDTVDYATQISVGTTMPYVRWKDMRNMLIIIPDEEIAESFNKQIQPIIDNIASLSEQIILLQQARDRLLPKLMSGEIEV